MWKVDERSGVQDGYYAKMLYSETNSGRVAGWEMMQLVIDALWPQGIGTVFRDEPVIDEAALRARILKAQKRYQRKQPPEASPQNRTHLRVYASAKEARP
jgi:hypothetical protein